MGALDGLRVIDLTMWFQGPVAGQWLADLGAEVIHVERPQGGDLGRGVRSIKALPVGDWNQYFLVINRNKKSLAVDLNTDSGRDVLYRLVKEADVFLTNVTRENLEKWQVTYDSLSSLNPRLIYATASGFGQFGTSNRPSFDLTVQALTGLMMRLGEPGQPPIYVGMGSGDAMGGLMTALAITIALHAREETGRGQLIDASLYGAQLFLAAPMLQGFLATRSDRFSRQQSRKAPENPLWNTYQAADKWIFLCLENNDENWAKLRATLGDFPEGEDSDFATMEKRRDNARELVAALDAAIRRRPAAEWLAAWQAAGLAAGPINNLADLANDRQAWVNDYLTTTHCDEVGREVNVRGFPIGFSKTPATLRSLGPELGQDTEQILVESLGYSWDEVVGLKEEGAVL
ncbi:MAG TPA: CoA transferase [Dehalococcoidia bacterium]|nr:CoA transferase [Dehalococcoidia bacterium]